VVVVVSSLWLVRLFRVVGMRGLAWSWDRPVLLGLGGCGAYWLVIYVKELLVMGRLKVLVVALLGVFVLAAFASASASAALPEVLNAKKVVPNGLTFTAESKKEQVFGILKGAADISCPGLTAKGSFEGTKPLGTVHIDFGPKCQAVVGGTKIGTCESLSDKEGNILVLSAFHIVFDNLTTLGAAVLFLLEEVHIKCVVLGTESLILVKGKVLCLITPIKALTKTFTMKCEAKELGDPLEVTYFDETGKEINIAEGLLGSEDEGKTFKMASQLGEVTLTPAEEVEIMA